MDRQTILSQALAAREQEVLEYQINIDNYRLAIVEAGKDPDLADFANRLRELLGSSVLEQKKAKVMLTVVEQQLEQIRCMSK